MTAMKVILILGLAGLAYHYWEQHQIRSDLAANVYPIGFLVVPTPTNLDGGTVIILAAENCPKDDAKRADQLALDVARRKVPVTRAHHAEYLIPDPNPALMKRFDSVTRGLFPLSS